MKLNEVNQHDLNTLEKVGPTVLGTILYEAGGQSRFKGAYVTTSERLLMNVDMNGEPYGRAFNYRDIESVSIEDGTLSIKFVGDMGKMGMVDIVEGDAEEFATFVNGLVQ